MCTALADLQQELLGVVRKVTAIQNAEPVHILPAPRIEREPRVIEAEVIEDPEAGAMARFEREYRGCSAPGP